MLRPARETDWNAIERWRADHFARMDARERANGAHVLTFNATRGLPDAVWIVACEDDVPVACLSFFDETEIAVRNAYDLFHEGGRRGIRGMVEIVQWLFAECDRKQFFLCAETDAVNAEYIAVIERFGCKPVYVGYQRAPGVTK